MKWSQPPEFDQQYGSTKSYNQQVVDDAPEYADSFLGHDIVQTTT